jgi:hypothetical protein
VDGVSTPTLSARGNRLSFRSLMISLCNKQGVSTHQNVSCANSVCIIYKGFKVAMIDDAKTTRGLNVGVGEVVLTNVCLLCEILGCEILGCWF